MNFIKIQLLLTDSFKYEEYEYFESIISNIYILDYFHNLLTLCLECFNKTIYKNIKEYHYINSTYENRYYKYYNQD